MAHVQLVFEKAEFFEHGIWCTGDDVIVLLQLRDVLLAQWLAFAGAAACSYLTGNTAAIAWRCEVFARTTRCLTHTPEKMLGFFLGLGVIVRHIAAQQIAK